jgi:hypothetical protein
MNTVQISSSLLNVIVFRWILTSPDGLMNSISEYIKIMKSELINNTFQSINHEVNVFHL